MTQAKLQDYLAERRTKRRKEARISVGLGAAHFVVVFGGLVLLWGSLLMMILGENVLSKTSTFTKRKYT